MDVGFAFERVLWPGLTFANVAQQQRRSGRALLGLGAMQDPVYSDVDGMQVPSCPAGWELQSTSAGYRCVSPDDPAYTGAGAISAGGGTDSALETATAVVGVLGLTMMALGTLAAGYHGYKRNRGSVGWTLAWAGFGLVFPLPTVVAAFAQGYGKPSR